MKTIYSIFFALLSILALNAQDDCSSSIAIEQDVIYTVDIIDGAVPTLFCVGSDDADFGEWYKYEADSAMYLEVTTDLAQNEGGDTRFHLYGGTCDNLTCFGGDDDGGSGYLSTASILLEEGQQIFIAFDDRWSANGFDFKIGAQDLGELPQFIQGTVSPGNSECVVDMNGDFLDDIVSVYSADNTIVIDYQNPDGTFYEETYSIDNMENSPSWSIAAGDIDKNGYNDLLLAGGSGVSFAYRSDDGSEFTEWTTPDYVFSQRSNFVDLNNDGHLDAFVCHDVQPNVYYTNDGYGNFSYTQGGMGDTPNGGNYGSVFLDYDNDGDQDLFLAKCRGGDNPANINQLHRNDGDGNFDEIALVAGLQDNVQTWSSAWADYDNDGDMDGYVGASSFENGPHKFMINNGSGYFTEAVDFVDDYTSTGIENAPYDYDNDGYVDVITNTGWFLHNDGDMTFTKVDVPFGRAAVGDLNNDGFLDYVASGSVYYFAGNDNNYLKVNTVGTSSNINGIGARITIVSDLGTQIRDVRSGESFSVMSSLTTHFGLGADTEIESLTINWPSGIVDVIENPAINTTINVTEGEATGIKELSILDLNIFPNPVIDNLTIQNVDIREVTSVEIIDNLGKVINSTQLTENRIDVSDLSKGVYTIKVATETAQFQAQFVKE